MKTLSVSIMLFAALLFTSCEEPDPVANFTGPTRAIVGETVKFNNTSTDASAYDWRVPNDQGPDVTSTAKDLTLSFGYSGTFKITLEASNVDGKSDTHIEYINIYD